MNTRTARPDDKYWLSGFAIYMSKIKITQEKMGKRTWNTSRNLEKPEEIRSESKYSGRQVRAVADDIKTNGNSKINAMYPDYDLVEDPQVWESRMFPGQYIYVKMIKRCAVDIPAKCANLLNGGEDTWRKKNGKRSGKGM